MEQETLIKTLLFVVVVVLVNYSKRFDCCLGMRKQVDESSFLKCLLKFENIVRYFSMFIY